MHNPDTKKSLKNQNRADSATQLFPKLTSYPSPTPVDWRNVNELGIYVVVQVYPWFKFYFPTFLGMVMYDYEFNTNGKKISTKDKTEPQHLSLKQTHQNLNQG